jgi:cation:H+ antiporter
MIVHILIFVVSLAMLSKGSDYFVEYAGRIAKRLGVSDFVIGLTLTSIGTSVPELAASISASLNDASGLVIGNVVGSNIANIGLILGVSAIISSFATDQKMYQRDGYIMLAAVILLFMSALDNVISTWESVSMLVGYLFYLLFIIKSDKEARAYHFQDFMKYIFDFEYIPPVKAKLSGFLRRRSQVNEGETAFSKIRMGLLTDLLVVTVSAIGIMFGARYLVQEAMWFAQLLSIPESVIGVSFVAVGTSLPELTVSISAARSGRGDMVVGNIIGSNIANILLILGTSGLLTTLQIQEISVVYTIPIMLFFSIALLYFIKSDWTISRSQGILAVLAYVAFMVMAFTLGWS